jgi:dihydrofolate synthase/folylpolyglutamate synthase
VGAAPVRVLDELYRLEGVQVGADGTRFVVRQGGASQALHTPLVGRHQARNALMAVAMLEAAGPPWAMPLAEAATALERVRLPGRFDYQRPWLFDVAHNPAGTAVLAETLAAVRPPGPVVAVVCVLRDKDWRGMLSALAPHVSRVLLTMAPTAPSNRAWSLDEAGAFAADRSIAAEVVPDFDAALARGASLGATVLVTGSFHTVGDAMARLQVSPLPG